MTSRGIPKGPQYSYWSLQAPPRCRLPADVASVKCTPPDRRNASVREIVTAHLAPGQVGDPPTVNSDAALRLSCTGYQGAEIAFNSRDADGCVLVRLVGATSRGHSGSRRELSL